MKLNPCTPLFKSHYVQNRTKTQYSVWTPLHKKTSETKPESNLSAQIYLLSHLNLLCIKCQNANLRWFDELQAVVRAPLVAVVVVHIYYLHSSRDKKVTPNARGDMHQWHKLITWCDWSPQSSSSTVVLTMGSFCGGGGGGISSLIIGGAGGILNRNWLVLIERNSIRIWCKQIQVELI